MDTSHEFFIEHCIHLAQKAKEKGSSPVGSVIVLKQSNSGY